MKALVFDQKLRLETDRPLPERPGEALVRVATGGICNTDLEITKGYMGFAGVLGHEFVGVVESAPEKNWVGRRVVADINCGACGTCSMCRHGYRTHCTNRTVLGIFQRDGAFAEYTSLPVENLHAVPDTLPDEAAVFTEPLAAALQIREQVPIRPDSRALVFGDGKLGLLISQVLRLAGTRTTLIGRHPENLKMAASWGVETATTDAVAAGDVPPAEMTVDVTGSSEGFKMALAHTLPRGTLVLKSTVAGETTANLAPVVVDEISIVGSRCGPFEPALRLLAAGEIETQPLLAADYPLDEGVEAIERARSRGTLKVLLRMA